MCVYRSGSLHVGRENINQSEHMGQEGVLKTTTDQLSPFCVPNLSAQAQGQGRSMASFVQQADLVPRPGTRH